MTARPISKGKRKKTSDKWDTIVPPNFNKKWGLSDVILRAKGANGKPLHVNKTVMATFSPYFNALFFADFAEKQQDVVDVDIEYDLLLEILRIIYSVNRNYGQTNHQLYPAKALAKLYRVADQYDFPTIRELTKQQMTTPPLSKENKATDQWNTIVPPNFDKKWGLSDVILRAKGANGKPLHANKTVMAIFSSYFNALFFSDFAEKHQDVFDVDIQYHVLLEILRIIHSVNRNYGQTNHKLYSLNALTKMYRVADQYDFPTIRELAKQQFVQIESLEAFEIAIELELHAEKSEVLKKMSFEDIQTFLNNKNDSLVLSPNDVAEIVKKCQEAEKVKVRCTHCGSTNVRETNNNYYGTSSQKQYNCNQCHNNFSARKS